MRHEPGDRADSGNDLIYERVGAIPRSLKMFRTFLGICTDPYGFAIHKEAGSVWLSPGVCILAVEKALLHRSS